MSLDKSIEIIEYIEGELEELDLVLLQSSNLKRCGATSTMDKEVLDRVLALIEMVDEKESNGEDHTVAKGLIETFLQEWKTRVVG